MNTFSFGAIGDYFKKKSSPAVSTLVVLIAIATINGWQLVLPNFAYDNSFSIAAAKNVYDGKGYALTSISPQDLFVTRYEPLNKWPPGYAWLLVLTYEITRADWITACYILNGLAGTFLILALRKILLLLQIPGRALNVYLLFAGSVPYPFMALWFSDLLAAVFFMWALAFLLKVIVKTTNPYPYTIVAGLLLGGCAWLKYLYLPVSPVPFLFLLVYAYKPAHRQLFRPMLCGSGVLIVSLATLLLFQRQHSGAAVYINPTGRGFFPESLLHLGPIVPGSLLDFKLFDMQLSALLHIPYQKMPFYWRGLNVLLMSGLLFGIFLFYRRKGYRAGRPLNIYMNLAVVVSATIAAVLMALSLSQAPYTSRYTAYWTYVEELRYFAVALLFIPQGILFLLLYRSDFLSRARKPFAAIVTIVAVIQIGHAIYYLPKQIFGKKEVGKTRKSEELDLLALKTARLLSTPGGHLLVCSDNREIANIASLSGIPVMYEYDSLNSKLYSSKPVTLLVVLDRQVVSEYNRFFANCRPKLLFTYKALPDARDDAYFYVAKIP